MSDVTTGHSFLKRNRRPIFPLLVVLVATGASLLGQQARRQPPAKEYIKILEDPHRIERLKPQEVINQLEMNPGDVVADIGSRAPVSSHASWLGLSSPLEKCTPWTSTRSCSSMWPRQLRSSRFPTSQLFWAKTTRPPYRWEFWTWSSSATRSTTSKTGRLTWRI